MNIINKNKELKKLANENVDKWEKRELGDRYEHTKASEFHRSTSTSIRLPVTMIADLKKIAHDEGIPYQTLIKSVLTKFIREKKSA